MKGSKLLREITSSLQALDVNEVITGYRMMVNDIIMLYAVNGVVCRLFYDAFAATVRVDEISGVVLDVSTDDSITTLHRGALTSIYNMDKI